MKKSKTFFACAMLVTLASCSSDHDLSQQNNTPSDPDVINIVAASSKPVTKAAVTGNDLQDTQFANGEKINVYLEENGGNTTTYSMLRYKVSSNGPSGGGSGKVLDLNMTDAPSQTAPHYPISGNGIDAYALYPALGTSASGYDITSSTNTFSVAEDQKNIADYRKSDLMFGTNNWDTNTGQAITGFEGTKKPKPVNLYFKHLLSKIIVKLKPGAGLTAENLKGATVKLYNAYPKANITVAKSGITVNVDNSSTIPNNGYILTDSYASAESSFNPDTYSGCAGIIIPQDIPVPTSDPQTKFIEITLASTYGSAKYVYNIADKDTDTSDNKMTFAPGNQYTYTLTLSAGNVVVVSTQIKNWNNNDIDGNADLQPAP